MIDQWINQNANDLQVAFFFTLFFIFSLAEVLEPKRPAPMRRRNRWLTNLLMTALNIAVISTKSSTCTPALKQWRRGSKNG